MMLIDHLKVLTENDGVNYLGAAAAIGALKNYAAWGFMTKKKRQKAFLEEQTPDYDNAIIVECQVRCKGSQKREENIYSDTDYSRDSTDVNSSDP
jgi:hypothetical protein